MSTIRLFTLLYEENNSTRKGELQHCLNKNISNKMIDKIVLLSEIESSFSNNKISFVKNTERPTFRNVFDCINQYISNKDDISILCNSDIFFNEKDILAIRNHIQSNECYALTRWDLQADGRYVFLNRRDSQDSWIFRGKLKNINADFYMGRPGCDNRLVHELQVAGYKVLNPSRTIQSIHYHLSQIKTYVRDENHTVPPPHVRLDPHFL